MPGPITLKKSASRSRTPFIATFATSFSGFLQKTKTSAAEGLETVKRPPLLVEL